MRIGIHTYSFNPNVGGIERVGNNLSRNLKYAGYEVFGISKNETASSNSSWTEHYTDTICANSQDIENGGGIIRDFIIDNNIDVFINLYFLPYETLELLNDIKTNTRCKIINVKQVSPHFLDSLKEFNRKLPIPRCLNRSIFAVYKQLVHIPKLKKAERMAYELSDATVVLGKTFIDELSQFARLKDIDKLMYIHNCTSFDITTHTEFAYQVSDKREFHTKQLIMLSLGRLCNSHKRIDRILEFWHRFHSVNDGWKLEIVGDGEDRAMLELLAKKKKLKDYAFLEATENPQGYFAKSRIFLMTSETEGFGMTIIEAMAGGCVPIVMDTFPTVHEIIDNKIDGIIVKRNDYRGMRNAANYICEHFEMMSNNAIIKSKKFTAEAITQKWIDLINKITDNK